MSHSLSSSLIGSIFNLSLAPFVCCFAFAILVPSALMASNSSNYNPFLDVYIRIVPTDDFCGAADCNITYALSVLTQHQFDLQSLALQDGHMMRHHQQRRQNYHNNNHRQYYFEENTVVRLSERTRRPGEKIYLGLMLFDIPADIQNYVLVEVSRTIQLGRSAKMEIRSDTAKISVQVYRGQEALAESNEPIDEEENSSNSTVDVVTSSQHNNHGKKIQNQRTDKLCTCVFRNCGCCEHVNVPKIHLDDEVCANISYVAADIGVRLALSVDNHVYYSKELSLRNPPPACFEVPHLREYASICVRLYNMEVQSKWLHGCVEMEAILLHLRVAREKLGCFSIPI